MIYLFHGSDTFKARQKAFQWVEAARQKAPDAVYMRIAPEQVSDAMLREALTAQGLFYTRSLILLDDPFSLADSAEVVLGLLDELAASENPVAIVAPKLAAARAKKLEAVASKVFTFEEVVKPSRGFNSGLVNALGARDGALLWLELQKAYRAGDVPEMVHGLMHWKARDMMQKGNPKWGKDGARMLSRDLITLLSDSRGGDLPLKEALERFALGI